MERHGLASPDFATLFQAHHASILAYAIRRTPTLADAEDAAAETFVVAWRRQRDVPADARPWLFAVARRVIANQRRGRMRWRRLRERLVGASHDVAVHADGGPATMALCRLRDEDQELLRLVAWEGLSHGEISIVLGITPNAVAIRLHRARRRYAEELLEVRSAEAKGSRLSRTPGDAKGTHE